MSKNGKGPKPPRSLKVLGTKGCHDVKRDIRASRIPNSWVFSCGMAVTDDWLIRTDPFKIKLAGEAHLVHHDDHHIRQGRWGLQMVRRAGILAVMCNMGETGCKVSGIVTPDQIKGPGLVLPKGVRA